MIVHAVDNRDAKRAIILSGKEAGPGKLTAFLLVLIPLVLILVFVLVSVRTLTFREVVTPPPPPVQAEAPLPTPPVQEVGAVGVPAVGAGTEVAVEVPPPSALEMQAPALEATPVPPASSEAPVAVPEQTPAVTVPAEAPAVAAQPEAAPVVSEPVPAITPEETPAVTVPEEVPAVVAQPEAAPVASEPVPAAVPEVALAEVVEEPETAPEAETPVAAQQPAGSPAEEEPATEATEEPAEIAAVTEPVLAEELPPDEAPDIFDEELDTVAPEGINDSWLPYKDRRGIHKNIRIFRTKEDLEQGTGIVTVFYTLQNVGWYRAPDGNVGVLNPARAQQTLQEKITADFFNLVAAGGDQAFAGEFKADFYWDRNLVKIRTLEEYLDRVVRILRMLDSPVRQVEIVTFIAETAVEKDFQWGLDASLTARDESKRLFRTYEQSFLTEEFLLPNARGGQISFLSSTANPHLKLDALLTAFARSALTTLKSEPRLRILEGQQGVIKNVQQTPIQDFSITGTNQVTTTTRYIPIGITMRVVPLKISDDDVTLHVRVESSDIVGEQEIVVVNTKVKVPVISNREAETTLTVGWGDFITIGGLTRNQEAVIEDKLPILGDIPLIGIFFKSYRKQSEDRMLDFYLQIRRPGIIIQPEAGEAAPDAFKDIGEFLF